MEEEIINPVVPEGSSTITFHEEQWSLLMEQSEEEKLVNEQMIEQISILNQNINSLNEVVGNTVATNITYEQAEIIITNLDLIIKGGKYAMVAVLTYFVFKMAYNLISGFFSGL